MDSLSFSALSGSIPIHLWNSCTREQDRVGGRGQFQVVRAVIVLLLDLYQDDLTYKAKPSRHE